MSASVPDSTAASARPAEPVPDPRRVRVAAGMTTVVLALVLLTVSGVPAVVHAVVFAAGALAGMRCAPYSVLARGERHALLVRTRA